MGWFYVLLLVFKGESSPGAVSVCRDYLHSLTHKHNAKWRGGALPNTWDPVTCLGKDLVMPVR